MICIDCGLTFGCVLSRLAMSLKASLDLLATLYTLLYWSFTSPCLPEVVEAVMYFCWGVSSKFSLLALREQVSQALKSAWRMDLASFSWC